MTIRLIPDWRKAWKFGSIQFLAVGGACQLTLVTLPAKVAEHTPEWIMQSLSIGGVACVFLAGLARVTKKEKPDVPKSPTTN